MRFYCVTHADAVVNYETLNDVSIYWMIDYEKSLWHNIEDTISVVVGVGYGILYSCYHGKLGYYILYSTLCEVRPIDAADILSIE